MKNWLLPNFVGIAVGDWWVLRSNGIDSHFMYYLIQNSNYQAVANLSIGTKMPRSDWNLVSSSYFFIPKNNLEQNDVSKILTNIDWDMKLLNKKLTLYRGIKEYMLQNLFPKDGENVPNARFADFRGDWEQHKLGELTNERNERSDKGELLSVTISNGVVKTSSLQRKNNSSKDMSNYKLVQKNDIVYNSMRMWQGASGVSQYSGIVSPAYTVIQADPRVLDTKFLGYVIKLNRMTWEFRIHSQGLTSDTWNLKYPLFSQIPVKIPSLEEQKKISNQLKHLDKSISDMRNYLETLSNLKTFLLQTLFI